MKSLNQFIKRLMLFVCSVLSTHIEAQNWNLFPILDTSYYYDYFPTNVPLKLTNYQDHNLMWGTAEPFVLWIDSSIISNNGDITHYFQPTVKPTILVDCIDTLGATLFGKKFVQTIVGSEIVFNAAGDSMKIEPKAGINTSWIFYNKNGLVFEATVTAIDTQIINGRIDSVKLINLNIIQGQAISPYYSNLYFYLSKHYGILESFSFDHFQSENYLTYYYKLDSQVYHSSKTPMDFGSEKYQPGNYWIYEIDTSYIFGFYLNHKGAIKDSVIASNIIPPNQIQYTIQRSGNGMSTQLISDTAFFSTIPTNYLSGIYPGYYNPSRQYDILTALRTYKFYLLFDTSKAISYSTYGHEILFDTCYHHPEFMIQYEKFTQSSNDYFPNLSNQDYKIWPAYTNTYWDISERIIYYKIGSKIYSPSSSWGISSLQLNGAYHSKNEVVLNWMTKNEQNTSHFEIQRSTDQIKFETISELNASGNSENELNYQYKDDISSFSFNDNFWYRIELVDLDGNKTYSNIIQIKAEASNSLSVFPNPFTDKINIQFNSISNSDKRIQLLNASGQMIFETLIPSNDMKHINTIQLNSNLKAGVYLLQIIDNESEEKQIINLGKR